MKYLTEKKIPLIIIAVCLLFLLHSKTANWNDEVIDENHSENAAESVNLSPLRLNEDVIYTCRLADEEIPAVQISELTDQNGRVMETVARVEAGKGIEKAIHGTGATWDYKSISARSGDDKIEITYAPIDGREDYDWILSLSGSEGFFSERVRDCMEVSDE